MFTYILSKKINQPYTVLLVLVWVVLVPISHIPVFGFLDNFTLNPNILFYIFLPILLFEAAYNINIKSLSKTWIAITSLSIIWVLISSFFIGGALYYIFDLAWFQVHFLVTLLFWAIISATDPVAVVSIFKSMWAPKRLTLLFEWESLFNDWTAVAIFMVILWIMMSPESIWVNTYFWWVLSFISMVFWWIIFWIISGFSFSKLLWKINYNEEVEISIALISSYITFIFASIFTHVLPISAIIATVVSAIVLWNYWKYKITPKSEVHMNKFLWFFTFLVNSIIFILMWIILFSVKIDFSTLIVPILITIIIVMLSRAVSIYFSIRWINFFHLEKRINDDWQKLLFWWWLRWVIALMMVLIIPWVWDAWYESILLFQQSVWWNFEYSIKEFLLFLTIWIIMFTTFVNAPTVSFVMRRMWVDRLHNYEKVEYEEWRIIANIKILKKLEKFYRDSYISKKEFLEVKKKYKTDLKDTINILNRNVKWNKEEINIFLKKFIYKYALWVEKQYLNKFFYNKKLDEKHYKYILKDIESHIFKIGMWMSKHNNIDALKKELKWEINKWIFFIKRLPFFKESYSDIDMYIIHRTRYELVKKVLKDIKKIPSKELWFDEEVLLDVSNFYENLQKWYKQKMQLLFDNNKINIEIVEWNIMNKYFLRLEEKLLKDLYQKDLIPHKFYINSVEKIQVWLYKDLKEN